MDDDIIRVSVRQIYIECRELNLGAHSPGGGI